MGTSESTNRPERDTKQWPSSPDAVLIRLMTTRYAPPNTNGVTQSKPVAKVLPDDWPGASIPSAHWTRAAQGGVSSRPSTDTVASIRTVKAVIATDRGRSGKSPTAWGCSLQDQD